MKYLYIVLLMAVFSSCKEKKSNVEPSWVLRNIDTVNACNIILPETIKVTRIGSGYTTFYTKDYGMNLTIQYYQSKYSETGIHYTTSAGSAKYYNDTCEMKSELRSFIKMKILEYKTQKQ